MDKGELRRLVGQRMLVGLASTRMDGQFEALVKEWKFGNVILMPRNMETAAQVAELCDDIQRVVLRETGAPALIATDQEGGTVTRLPGEATHMPGAMALAAAGDAEAVRLAARVTATELRAMGINMNLAPVLDVNVDYRNPVIAERSFGDDPQAAARYGLAAIAGLAEGGALACAKHFPGHGDTYVDSHLGLPVVDKSAEELRALELIPFAAAVKAGVPSIMTSHIRMPALEPEPVPNTLSRAVITGLLRGELGYDGLVVSDCMEMKAIKDNYGVGKGALLAAKAGVDVLCVCHTPELMIEAAQAMYDGVLSGEIDMAEMERSAGRVARIKGQIVGGQPPLSVVGCAEHRAIERRARLRAFCLAGEQGALPRLGERPLFVGPKAHGLGVPVGKREGAYGFAEWMAEALGGTACPCAADPTDEEVGAALAAARGASCVVLGTYNGQFRQGQLKLLRGLAACGVPLIHIALRSPYDLAFTPKGAWRLAAFECTLDCYKLLAETLRGDLPVLGRLPVALPERGGDA